MSCLSYPMGKRSYGGVKCLEVSEIGGAVFSALGLLRLHFGLRRCLRSLFQLR